MAAALNAPGHHQRGSTMPIMTRACLALALTSTLGVASATTVGETHRATTTPTAAMRDATICASTTSGRRADPG